MDKSTKPFIVYVKNQVQSHDYNSCFSEKIVYAWWKARISEFIKNLELEWNLELASKAMALFRGFFSTLIVCHQVIVRMKIDFKEGFF